MAYESLLIRTSKKKLNRMVVCNEIQIMQKVKKALKELDFFRSKHPNSGRSDCPVY
jgi:hypothetical protein